MINPENSAYYIGKGKKLMSIYIAITLEKINRYEETLE